MFKYKVYVLISMIISCCLMTGCFKKDELKNNEIEYKNTQDFFKKEKTENNKIKRYSVTKSSDGEVLKYQIEIYNKNGDIVLKEEGEREPHINEIGNILEITTSHGSSATMYRYYDTETDTFSAETFWNRNTVTDDKKIIYMDIDEKKEEASL